MKVYTGPYKVVKVFKVSRKRKVLARGLSLDEAREMVGSFPDCSRSMVVFYKQYTSDKWFKQVND